MRDEIWFRAKNFDNRKWLYGLIHYSYDSNENPCIAIGDDEIDDETVGQFSGYQDKHGERIFEGDFVRDSFGFLKIVKFKDTSFVLIDHDVFYRMHDYTKNTYAFYRINELEVVGNIHDNKKLMEEYNDSYVS